MTLPRFDIDLDKHYNATVVIACTACGHETRHALASLLPDNGLRCRCGNDISLSARLLLAARQKATAIKTAYHIR